MSGPTFRVIYRNKLDGLLHVFIGGLTKEQADAVLARWGDKRDPNYYMGPATRIESCDGTPDGAVIEEAGSAA